MQKEEQLMKVVKTFGNGAHIFVPKEWVGEQITLIRPKIKSYKEKIVEIIRPYFESISGVYLYGSYARDEQREGSDIDLLVISNKKIKIQSKGFEINCIEKENIQKAVKIAPLLMYAIFSEAQVIINSGLLEELKSKYQPQVKYFKEYFDSCKRIIKINQEFLNSEAKEQYSLSQAVPYSIMLRLRGVFIIHNLLKGDKYSYKEFKKWIIKKSPQVDFDAVYEVYKNAKDEVKSKQKIKTENLYVLLELLKNEVELLEYGKKRKEA
jgi:predicted nucleotidyltransferase